MRFATNYILSLYQNVFQVFLPEIFVHLKGFVDFLHLSGHKNRTDVVIITMFDQTQMYI